MPSTDDFFVKYDTEKAERLKKRDRKARTAALEAVGWVELFCVALVAVILFITIVARHSPVNGDSMYPTLIGSGQMTNSGDVLLISNLGYKPRQGDIVIIQVEGRENIPYVKRVIAVGGQTLKIDFFTWSVWVDGKLIEERGESKADSRVGYTLNYIDEPMKSGMLDGSEHYKNGIYEKKIDDGRIFVMGDNRQNSEDSRVIGEIDALRIVGEAKFRLFPLKRFGKIK